MLDDPAPWQHADVKLLWKVAAVGALACMPCQSDGADPAPAPARVGILVLGAVERMGTYFIEPGATVDDALKLAGGAKPNANLNTLNVQRKDSTGKFLIIHITLGEAKSFPLKRGDAIIVKEKLE